MLVSAGSGDGGCVSGSKVCPGPLEGARKPRRAPGTRQSSSVCAGTRGQTGVGKLGSQGRSKRRESEGAPTTSVQARLGAPFHSTLDPKPRNAPVAPTPRQTSATRPRPEARTRRGLPEQCRRQQVAPCIEEASLRPPTPTLWHLVGADLW